MLFISLIFCIRIFKTRVGSQMTSPHRRGGGKSRRYRRLVTYEHADESRGESPHHHSAVRCRRSHTFSPLHTATSEYQPINGSVRYSLNSSHQRCEFLRPAINAASFAQPSTLRCLSQFQPSTLRISSQPPTLRFSQPSTLRHGTGHPACQHLQ